MSYFVNTINTGHNAFDGSLQGRMNAYLINEMGFSNASVLAIGANPYGFATEYEAKFGKKLDISDAYKLFDNVTAGGFQHLLVDKGSLCYSITSGEQQDRIDVYKEMFMEKMSFPGVTTEINVSTEAAYTQLRWDYRVNTTPITSLNFNNEAARDLALFQLESEANALKSELHENEMQLGGLPQLQYTDSIEAKTKLLEHQIDAAMQDFLTCYSELFAHYKIEAGEHKYDNDNSTDYAIDPAVREKEGATAASLAAFMALEYAHKYHAQTIKPTVESYVFGQAPIAFSELNASGVRVGFSGAQISESIETYLDMYNLRGGPSDQLKRPFNDFYPYYNGYDIKHRSFRLSVLVDEAYRISTDEEYDDNFFWNTNQRIEDSTTIQDSVTYNDGQLIPEDDRKDVPNLTIAQMREIGTSVNQYVNWLVRDSYGVGGITEDILNTEYCAEEPKQLALSIFDAAQKMVDLQMQLLELNITTQVNNKLLAEYEARLGAIAAISCPTGGTDPYIVEINGQDYMLGQDKDNDGTINSMLEILGLRDSQDNLFESLKNLDQDNDGYVSQEELQANNIILTGINKDGQLTSDGYDIGRVKGIDLSQIQEASGANNIFGRFTMDLQNNQKAMGVLTFEDDAYFQRLFGWDLYKSDEDVNEYSAIIPKAVPTSNTTQETEEIQPEEVVEIAETTSDETVISTTQIETDDFSFDFSDANDNKSAIEKLWDEICWKLGITGVSSTQKYNIIDSIDADVDIEIAETTITQNLENLNLSA